MSAADRREQLLDVTTAMVAEHGFSAVTIEAVARQAGITRPIVYEHFGDLPGLLTAAVNRETARALAQVSETEVSELTQTEVSELTPSSARDLLLESLQAFLHAVRGHPTTWRLVLMPIAGAPRILHTLIEDGRSAVLARLAHAVGPALAREGESADAELTARALSAMADEYARLVLTDPQRYPPDRLLAHARWFLGQLAL